MKETSKTSHRERPVVVVALPFAYREGVDEYNGIMRHLRESSEDWDLRIVRHSFDAQLFRGLPPDAVDGVVCGIDTHPGLSGYEPYFDGKVLEFLASRSIPVVGIDLPFDLHRYAKRGAKCAFVSLDSEAIGRKAAQHLVRLGCYESFGFVGSFADRGWSRDRGAFFARELRSLGRRNVRIFQGEVKGRKDELLAWLKRLPKPAAVFASNDYCAAAVLHICEEGDLRVPDDLAVLGVDDDPILCIHTRPSLSSIRPDFESEGYLAAKTLSMLMKGEKASPFQLVGGSMTVTDRMSTAPCAPSGRLVRRADEIIAERACKGLNSDIIADMLGISRRLLDLRYRQINGITVREAIENARMARARKLLTTTRLSHREIARSCGYSSEAYMEHVFVKLFGKTMSEYRRGRASARPK